MSHTLTSPARRPAVLSRATLATFAALSAGLAAAAGAQVPQTRRQAAPETLTAEYRKAVVDSVAAHLTRFYAVADTGRMIAEHVKRRHAQGAYEGVTSPQRFAELLSVDLKAINGDRHLAVFVAGPGGGGLPPGTTRLPRMGFAGRPGGQGMTPPPQVVAAERRNHFNLGRVDILPGNVGYFDMRGFSNMPEAQDAVVHALRYLEFTDAIILDVRNHPGGGGALSNFIVSHFTGKDTVHTLDVYVRANDERQQRWTLPEVPGPRRPDVPVYILTGRGTVSAGEDFAFVMKNLGRATLVGETTAGAGRNNPSFDTGLGFLTSVSVSQVKDPKTGAEWEGTGVQPHVRVPVRTALEAAHSLALRSLAERADDPMRKRALEMTREYVEAQARPRAVPAATLKRYEGVYGGERTFTVENGQLWFRRSPERMSQELVALSDSTFALGPLVRLAFEQDGAAWRLRITPPGAEPLVLARTGPVPNIPSEWR